MIETYFNGLAMSCKRPVGSCALCEEVRTRVVVDFLQSSDGADAIFALIDTVDHFRMRSNTKSINWSDIEPHATRDKKGKNPDSEQVPIIHEFGHWLGLEHPGHEKGRPANTRDDYEDDYESLMGRGLSLRQKDYDKIFCKYLNWNCAK